MGLLDDQYPSMTETPRKNRLVGLLADAVDAVDQFARKPFGYDNPPAQMLSDVLGVPAVQQTLNRISYGDRLTQGKGQTLQVRPEVIDAGMAAAPIAAKFPRATLGAVGMLAGAGGDAGGLSRAATVWHGTPHKFDRFDSSKIGTGSGVDAQGAGLYFSDAKRVADAYAGDVGNVYSVNIPDEDIAKMLEWQEKIAAQPRSVRRGVLGAIGGEDYRYAVRNGATGSDIYNNYMASLSQDEASRSLAMNGIPGIRYAGNGTTNTVVFPGEENMLTILERNGQRLK